MYIYKPRLAGLAIACTCIFLILNTGLVYGQRSKDSLVRIGKQYFAREDFVQAYAIFSRVLEDSSSVNPDNYYYGIVSAAQAKRMDRAFEWLRDYTGKVGAPQVNFYRLQFYLEQLYEDPRWPECLAAMRRKLKTYDQNKGYDIPLKDTLSEIFYRDQKDRIRIAPYEKIYGDSSVQMQQLWENIGHFDSLNLVQLQGLWNAFGWLSKSKVGSDAVTQWAVIQHADLATQRKYLPMLKTAAAKGDIRKSSLALTIDRIREGEGKKQLYGSQVQRIKWQGQYINVIDPMEDPQNVDRRRKEMEMEPMATYAKHFDIDWSLKNYEAGLEKIRLSDYPDQYN